MKQNVTKSVTGHLGKSEGDVQQVLVLPGSGLPGFRGGSVAVREHVLVLKKQLGGHLGVSPPLIAELCPLNSYIEGLWEVVRVQWPQV